MTRDVALLLALQNPAAGSDVPCPDDRTGVESALERQREADDELDAGHLARAAVLLAEVAESYPECTTYHGRRMMAILRSVETLLAANEKEPRQVFLDVALRRIDRYLESLSATYGEAASTTPGYGRLAEIRHEVDTVLPRETADEIVDEPVTTLESAPTSPAVPRPEAAVKDEPTVARPAKAWRSLALGGGFTIGIGAALGATAIAGAALQVEREKEVRDPAIGCTKSNIELPGRCNDLDREGNAYLQTTVVTTILAPIFVGAGAALLAIASFRKRANLAASPTIQPRFAGMVISGYF